MAKKKLNHKTKSNKEILVAVSGGFDPIHPGHIRLIREAKKLGTKLIVILNNDNWIKHKKGQPFMNEKERKEVLEALRDVDKVVLSNHKPKPSDMSVSATLAKIKPDVFANGGDRNKKNAADPKSSLYTDIKTCKKIKCKMLFNVGKGGKIQSSSWLLEKYSKAKKK